MRIISKRRINEFAGMRSDAREPLERWYRITKRAEWKSFPDIREVFPHADWITIASGKTVIVFNIAGTKYRLVTAVHFNIGRVYVLVILTHAEYSRESWKEVL